ncbi:hypothetical protein HK102_011381 [Quaeritorhiza haematococci]|nr:hypothetical protein HK102_011381 [Quaeritorhiza haematococci]
MEIIEIDGNVVKPMNVSSLEINAGQRYSVLVRTNREPKDYWMEADMRWRPNATRTGYAVLSYNRTSKFLPVSEGTRLPPKNDTGQEQEKPEWITPSFQPADADAKSVQNITKSFVVTMRQLGDDGLKWTMNNVSFVHPHEPLLFAVYENRTNEIGPESSMYDVNDGDIVEMD